MPDASRRSQWSSVQKTGATLLVIFGVLALGLGVLQMRHSLYGPFIVRQPQSVNSARLELQEEARLQQIDTDQDGINDYEELNFFNTSPYLPDTDSDGISDKKEIDAGSDPLCPEGESCAAEDALPVNQNTSTQVSPLFNQANDVTQLIGQTQGQQGPTASSTASANIDEMLSDPAAIRELLVQTGQLTREQVEQIPDETLLSLAREIAAEQITDTPSQQRSASTATSSS